MKLLILSDIHGNIDNLNKVLTYGFQENVEKIIILGDLFDYYDTINNDFVANKLNLYKDKIICVRGNCDYNINNIVFNMPYHQEISLNNKKFFITHGHIYDKMYLNGLNSDIILTGHTHIPKIDIINNKVFINPGSISKSRVGDNTFIILTNNKVILKNIENIIIQEMDL